MRSLLLGSLAVGLMSVLVACGDDTTATGGSGGAGASGGEGGSGNTTNNGGGGSTGDGGGGAAGECTAISSPDFGEPPNGLSGTTTPAIGGADPDVVIPIWTGVSSGPLTTPANVNDCGETMNCLAVIEDNTGMGFARLYFATSGDMEVTSVEGDFYAAGSFSGHLEEATFDQDTGAITLVDGGACLDLSEVTFDVQPPVAGWTCDPSYYDETTAGAAEPYCDCTCGAVDPDCSNAANPVAGCFEGQTCGATAECEGVPTDWTCADDQFDGGAGNGCDCACGTPDPDCDLMPAETVEGCAAGDTCSGGVCLPAGWACSPAYYGADDGCDCGCGAPDPDCADATLASCEYCNNDGSCSTMACAGNTEIDPANNATCL